MVHSIAVNEISNINYAVEFKIFKYLLYTYTMQKPIYLVCKSINRYKAVLCSSDFHVIEFHLYIF